MLCEWLELKRKEKIGSIRILAFIFMKAVLFKLLKTRNFFCLNGVERENNA